MNESIESLRPLFMILVPAAFAALILALPEKQRGVRTAALIAGAAFSLALTILTFGKPLSFTRAWAGWGMEFSLKLTGAGGALLIAASALTLLVVAFEARKSHGKLFDAGVLFALAMASGALLANNLVAMMFFWQALWLPLFVMISAGGENAQKTAVKAVVTAGVSDLCLMLGMGLAALAAGGMTMDLMRVPMNGLGAAAFLLMAVGAVSKLGAMPFHGWILDAADEAPAPFMALFPGALNVILGGYLLFRLNGIFEAGGGSGAKLALLTVGSLTVLLAGALALHGRTLKRVIAYLSIAQAGALMLPVAAAKAADPGFFAILLCLGAAASAILFLEAGKVEAREGTTELAKLVNLPRKMPNASSGFLAAFLAFFVVASSVVYGLTLERIGFGMVFLILALIGAAFALAAVLRLSVVTLFGKPSKAPEDRVSRVPALGAALAWAEKTRLDPYPPLASLVKGYSNVSLKINDAISWFYDVAVVRFVGFLSLLVRKAHNGSQSRYVLWVLLGAVIVVVLFVLS